VDNTQLNVGTAGDVIRSEDRAGVKTQVVGLDLGIGTGSEVLMAGMLPVASSNETGTVYSGTTALVPKFAVISASASGNTPVVAAVSGKKIRVLRWSVSANGAVNVKFQRGTTDVTGLYYLAQYASIGGGYCPVGHFETAVTEALNINLSANVAVGGVCTYIEV
jgi:hypothetical protein